MISGGHGGPPVLLDALIGAALAQLIKFGLYSLSRRGARIERLVGAGGMPSAHAAMVVGLATGVRAQRGWHSVSFAIATVLAFIVMYDAMSVRRTVGRQSRYLNTVRGANAADENPPVFPEFVGHTPWEVVVGGILGGLVATLMGLVRW